MKLQQVEFEGIGTRMRVHLFMGDAESADASVQWLQSTVEVQVRGVMDIDVVQKAALAKLRDLLNKEIDALPGPLQRTG